MYWLLYPCYVMSYHLALAVLYFTGVHCLYLCFLVWTPCSESPTIIHLLASNLHKHSWIPFLCMMCDCLWCMLCFQHTDGVLICELQYCRGCPFQVCPSKTSLDVLSFISPVGLLGLVRIVNHLIDFCNNLVSKVKWQISAAASFAEFGKSMQWNLVRAMESCLRVRLHFYITKTWGFPRMWQSWGSVMECGELSRNCTLAWGHTRMRGSLGLLCLDVHGWQDSPQRFLWAEAWTI